MDKILYPKSFLDTFLEERREKSGLDQAEEIVLSMRHMSTENRQSALKRMRFLEKQAYPGNWAHNELCQIWGYSDDYMAEDNGTHKSDNE